MRSVWNLSLNLQVLSTGVFSHSGMVISTQEPGGLVSMLGVDVRACVKFNLNTYFHTLMIAPPLIRVVFKGPVKVLAKKAVFPLSN